MAFQDRLSKILNAIQLIAEGLIEGDGEASPSPEPQTEPQALRISKTNPTIPTSPTEPRAQHEGFGFPRNPSVRPAKIEGGGHLAKLEGPHEIRFSGSPKQ